MWPKKTQKNKFGAKRCEVDGKKFPSILEKNCYLALESIKRQEKISYFTRQIAFDLPGGFKHYVDFMVVTPSKTFYIEAKGRDLALGRLKRLQVMDLYKIEILVVNRPSQIISLFS